MSSLRPLPRRALAVLLAVTLAAPAAATLFGGLGHGLFHHLERSIRHQLHLELTIAPPETADSGFVHSHGPGAEPHRHAPLLDLALEVAAADPTSEAPQVPTVDRAVDLHLPALRTSSAAPPTMVLSGTPEGRRPSGTPRLPPPLPPPRG